MPYIKYFSQKIYQVCKYTSLSNLATKPKKISQLQNVFNFILSRMSLSLSFSISLRLQLIILTEECLQFICPFEVIVAWRWYLSWQFSRSRSVNPFFSFCCSGDSRPPDIWASCTCWRKWLGYTSRSLWYLIAWNSSNVPHSTTICVVS